MSDVELQRVHESQIEEIQASHRQEVQQLKNNHQEEIKKLLVSLFSSYNL